VLDLRRRDADLLGRTLGRLARRSPSIARRITALGIDRPLEVIVAVPIDLEEWLHHLRMKWPKYSGDSWYAFSAKRSRMAGSCESWPEQLLEHSRRHPVGERLRDSPRTVSCSVGKTPKFVSPGILGHAFHSDSCAARDSKATPNARGTQTRQEFVARSLVLETLPDRPGAPSSAPVNGRPPVTSRVIEPIWFQSWLEHRAW